jgi:hypothetical protein
MTAAVTEAKMAALMRINGELQEENARLRRALEMAEEQIRKEVPKTYAHLTRWQIVSRALAYRPH